MLSKPRKLPGQPRLSLENPSFLLTNALAPGFSRCEKDCMRKARVSIGVHPFKGQSAQARNARGRAAGGAGRILETAVANPPALRAPKASGVVPPTMAEKSAPNQSRRFVFTIQIGYPIFQVFGVLWMARSNLQVLRVPRVSGGRRAAAGALATPANHGGHRCPA